MGWVLMSIALIVILLLLLLGLSLGKAARRGDDLVESALRELDLPGPETPSTTKAENSVKLP
jgi:hypothetical protein